MTDPIRKPAGPPLPPQGTPATATGKPATGQPAVATSGLFLRGTAPPLTLAQQPLATLARNLTGPGGAARKDSGQPAIDLLTARHKTLQSRSATGVPAGPQDHSDEEASS